MGGALYLYDVAIFDHFAQQLLVFRFILFLLQFCSMLKKKKPTNLLQFPVNNTYLQELMRELEGYL